MVVNINQSSLYHEFSCAPFAPILLQIMRSIDLPTVDIVRNSYAFLTTKIEEASPEEKIWLDFNNASSRPLFKSVDKETFNKVFEQGLFKRPTPMMRYPITFSQDPIFWGLIDNDWYVSTLKFMYKIQRQRAAVTAVEDPKYYQLDIAKIKYLQENKYGCNGDARYLEGPFASLHKGQNTSFKTLYKLVNELTAGELLGLSLYARHAALGTIDKLIAESALIPEFWQRIKKLHGAYGYKIYGEIKNSYLGFFFLDGLLHTKMLILSYWECWINQHISELHFITDKSVYAERIPFMLEGFHFAELERQNFKQRCKEIKSDEEEREAATDRYLNSQARQGNQKAIKARDYRDQLLRGTMLSNRLYKEEKGYIPENYDWFNAIPNQDYKDKTYYLISALEEGIAADVIKTENALGENVPLLTHFERTYIDDRKDGGSLPDDIFEKLFE